MFSTYQADQDILPMLYMYPAATSLASPNQFPSLARNFYHRICSLESEAVSNNIATYFEAVQYLER